MKTGLKVWLWVWFVLGIIAILGDVMMINFAGLVTNFILVAGVGILLFKQEKTGFYLMCGGCVITGITNILSGANIIMAIIGAAIIPSVTYLLMNK